MCGMSRGSEMKVIKRIRAKFSRIGSRTEKVATGYRDFPDMDDLGHRKAVCKRCGAIMNDCEPCSPNGEYYHPSTDKRGKPHSCPNAGICFSQKHLEIVPFLRKSVRRRYKRLGVRP